jgi:hypothetical protein
MPSRWRGAPDLSNHIFGALGFFLLALMLLWPELGVVGRTSVSLNKSVFLSTSVVQIIKPLLAGYGGKGGRLGGEWCGATKRLLASRGG